MADTTPQFIVEVELAVHDLDFHRVVFYLAAGFNLDRIRVVTDVNKNTVLNPNDGTSTPVTDVFYDAGDAATVEDIKHFTYTYLADESSMHGWEIALISPTRFAAFVCHRVVGSWRSPSYAD